MRFLTNAPAAYDYGYTEEVGTSFWRAYPEAAPVPVRVVQIPEEHATYQTGRYQSGSYVAVEA